MYGLNHAPSHQNQCPLHVTYQVRREYQKHQLLTALRATTCTTSITMVLTTSATASVVRSGAGSKQRVVDGPAETADQVQHALLQHQARLRVVLQRRVRHIE
jgi:hypothetical protein